MMMLSSRNRPWVLTLAFVGFMVGACRSNGGGQGTGGQGGANSHGGTSASGGVPATGGVTATGGTIASGGVTGQGGRGGQGGTVGLRDAAAPDGLTGTGGVGGQGGSALPDAGKDLGATGGAGGSTGSTGSTGADAASDAPKPSSYNIMSFGDSITASSCPPQMLDQTLKAKGHTNYAFVGTKVANQSCNGAPNTKCEGQGGIWATNLVPGGANPDLLAQWATGSKYDVVLMHLGTNDCWSPGAVPDLQKVIDAYSIIIDAFRKAKPNVIVFVAQLIPLHPSDCSTCETRVQQLNALIPAFATSKTTTASPVYVANIHAAFDGLSYTPSSSYTTDGAHPTPAGSQLMADAWYAAMQAHGIP